MIKAKNVTLLDIVNAKDKNEYIPLITTPINERRMTKVQMLNVSPLIVN